MTNPIITDHIISSGATLREALDAINNLSGRPLILFSVDRNEKLAGSITDGDIRRALLRGENLDSPVENAMNRNCLRIENGGDETRKVAEGKRRKLRLIPVTSDGKISEILDLDSIRAILPLDAVMMAGGKGERLRPLTLETPKPLLKVGGKPIIDRNIERLEEYGLRKTFVTVNYLREKIEEHFEARNNATPSPRARVECVLEPTRLGTLGSLSLIEGLTEENLLIMNSDLLTTIDFKKMLDHHISTGAALTVGAVPYTVSIPYAIMRTEGNHVRGLEEKPTFNYFANGGVYIMRSKLLERIPKGEYLDAPDFIERLISEGEKVEMFPIDGGWIDIGNPDDFRTANEILSYSE